ncbi:LpxL/LpxP family acyltransferase [Dokdonella immobilis]|uniref:Lipid A biosynthesis acyltransferase n=1 Tax=Dokdonella immobilis TaxID=578942 RepID=A0A1I4ZNB0_9GAMM|nr:hypothetical protein [Dokdonella immobilis]SFN51523.1 lipid A biosynthesis acyltransferase [Dokdonella immobilis]
MQDFSRSPELGKAAKGVAGAAQPNPGVTRPGEFIHYYTNLLGLLGRERSAADIRSIAQAASESRERAIDGFAARLRELETDFRRQRTVSGDRPEQMPKASMRGWDLARLESIRNAHGGALIALFHFGEHRQVFTDLACLGVPYVAPVAKQAYFDCCETLGQGPEPFRHAMSLLEVEDSRVGRKLVAGVRQGRLGLIYVDGNMGPDGHLVEEGAVRVDFLGRRIRVKAGIARLALGLALPIVPLFATGHDDAVVVRLNPVIMRPPRTGATAGPPPVAAIASIMQSLYEQLGDEVLRAPQQWEFAFCFHRWIEECEPAVADRDVAELSDANGALAVDPQRIAEYRRDGEVFWIHVGRQRAYRLPDWADGLYARLDSKRLGIDDSLAYLQRKGGPPDQTRALVSGLVRLGLLAQVRGAA